MEHLEPMARIFILTAMIFTILGLCGCSPRFAYPLCFMVDGEGRVSCG